MPKVSYIKGLDVFLNFCFVMVFASLVEYAVVSYMNKKLGQRREKKRKRAEAMPQTTEFPMFANYAPMSPNQNTTYNYRAPGLPSSSPGAVTNQQTAAPGNAMTPDCDCRYGSVLPADPGLAGPSNAAVLNLSASTSRTTNTIAYARKLLKIPGRLRMHVVALFWE